MNSELTVAESFDSLGHFFSHCISIFLTSNSCECPHRLLDLIVKERGSLAAVGCASYASHIQSQAHFTVVCSGAFSPADTAPLTPGSSRFALSARRHYRDLAELGKGHRDKSLIIFSQ